VIIPTSTFSASPSFTESLTPAPTGTAVVPAVLSTNIFRPLKGGSLTIDFKPAQDGRVTVKIFNLSGEHIRKPFEADVKAGLWLQASWDGHNEDGSMVASGVYFVSVQGAGIKSVRKVILLK
jgi:flagellar hook assembly protein FlgD